jgi:hypothetical protein
MLLDRPWFLHNKFSGCRVTPFGGGRNGRLPGRNFNQGGKMFIGIEKGTKTVK